MAELKPEKLRSSTPPKGAAEVVFRRIRAASEMSAGSFAAVWIWEAWSPRTKDRDRQMTRRGSGVRAAHPKGVV